MLLTLRPPFPHPSRPHFHIDNIGVLTGINHGSSFKISQFHQIDNDINCEILAFEVTFPYKVVHHHVKAHTPNHTTNPNLIPMPTRLNKYCDQQALIAHNCPKCPSPKRHPLFPSTPTYFLIHNTPFQAGLPPLIQHQQHNTLLKTWIIHKESWTDAIYHNVNWSLISAFLRNSTHKQRKVYTKLQYQLWPTNRLLNIYNNTHSPQFYQCHAPTKTCAHIL